MILGEIECGKGAHPHLHTGIEQVCYLLEGAAQAKVLMIYSPPYLERPG